MDYAEIFMRHFEGFIDDTTRDYYEELTKVIDFIKGNEVNFIYSKKPFNINNAEHYFFLDSGMLVVKKEEEKFTLDLFKSRVVKKSLTFSGRREANLTLNFENGEEIEFDAKDCNEAHEFNYAKSIKDLYKLI
ncbi:MULTISPECIES: DUF3908 family protein [Bacillus]|uniref:DUF3908 family protein n=1 Tax=Bacillus TaxID=1386 RepID=UPI00148EB043|nr:MULTISPECIES: DUF3908 family protein [Bacillus]MBW4850927.1 DUF3908 family protein [Bacillaceae bacterium]MBW4851782.1 DUF3908 family protein [Bacillaceae bacterium]MBW4855915.1 DUF3908 family protein [Bacillaceae bacterium]NOL32098.1 DUF3908 domain-containing protein [Bacillus altitudinis]